MLYGIIRSIFSMILIISSILLFKKSKKKILLLCIIPIITLILTVWFIPVENLFVSFDSPQAVFEYAGQGEIIDTVENTTSVALITKKNNNFSTFFVIKNDNKYKIPNFNSSIKLTDKNHNSVNLCLYNIKGTNDYYLRIWGIVTDELALSDSCNSNFNIHYEQVSDRMVVNSIVPLTNIDDYRCYINGDEIVFE